MFRGPEGSGRVLEGLPAGEGPIGFDLGWKIKLGSGYSGISVAEGLVVTAMASGERDFVVALDAKTGEEVWRLDLAPTYAGHDGSHTGPIATPAIADGRVFMVGPFGEVTAIDLKTGKRLWAGHLAEDLGREVPFYGFGGSPLIVGDTLVVQVGGEAAVVGLDVATGKLRWQALSEAGDLGAQSPIATEIGGQLQVLILASTKLAGLDPLDGAVLWEFALEGQSSAMGSYSQSPLPIGNDRIFVKHRDDETLVVEVKKTDNGWQAAQVATSRALSKSYSPPSLGNEALFGYTARFLSAIDPNNGEVLWRSRQPGDGFLVNVAGQLAVLTKKGTVHLGSAGTEGWTETARLRLFEDLAWTPPSWADGALFMRSLGEIARVDLVRRQRSRATLEETALPAALAPLRTALLGARNPEAEVERFLKGKELPLINDEEVVFLWHGPAEDLAIGGDMIGMRREEPMQRLEGTDLWWWSTHLDRQARISYLFFVDYQPAVDPTHDRRRRSTVLGPDMNWNQGQGVEMSWFAMPQWPGLTGKESAQASAAGRMETIEVSVQPPTPEEGDIPEPVTVSVQLWLPPGYDQGEQRYPVVYVHHPEALKEGAWQEALDRVVGKTVAPLIAVFPDPPRVRGFGALLAEQVIPEIDSRYRTQADPAGRANVGMGWQGFTAAMITFSHPETFGGLGIQSLYMLKGQVSALEGVTATVNAESLPLNIYLEWGRWDLISPHEEMNFRASSRMGWDFFSGKGWQPIGGEVWDSTDFASWANRTDLLLQSLFPHSGAQESLEAWRTGN